MPLPTFFNLPETKRDHILDVAITEFASRPYEAASISDIVRKTGIAKGSFYQYFTDKKDLYQYLIELGNTEKLNLMKTLPAPDPNADLFGYFRWLFKSTVYFEIQYPLHAGFLYRAFVEEIPFPEMTEELQRRGPTQFFKQLLAQGILHGAVAPFVDPNMAAFLLEAAYYRFGRYFVERLDIDGEAIDLDTLFDHDEAQGLVDNLLDIFQAGIQNDPEIRQSFFPKA